ncbi:Glycerol kinase [Gemmata obscuriglobus]|uniref:glycerol kinase GlpK n=1 Tax=Gemmata obscuriglobus TaxID=114 RepID=UPI00016C56E0|nr:glycerol kinase GlpK [Gemmata obscuriglobus]QEG32423.1 Glycerol kinase [Gemmata obscuriglobus]VTS11779.1 glycerol kinase : Glycerol kinase OS=Hoeflea phototrophica DFL-43 GN=glpK PE=3 SV=1: FGGY_N: FGGY_C [Gemmata obscuriglobus UQM 2246]
MTSPVLLSIDQGTTSSRAVVYDASTFTVLGAAQQEIEQHYPHDGWVEHEPEDIWYSVARTVREALAKAGRDPKSVAAVGITNQRETVVVWDRATGRPVHRAIVWQDRRTTDFCRTRAADQPALTAKTGLVLDPYFSGTKLHWLFARDSELAARAARGELACGTIDTFLIWRLTAGRAHATDATNASRTLLFNIHTLQWDDELLSYFGVPRATLPDVKPSVAEFGTTKGLDFLPDGVPIRGVAGDQQAALFGQGCFSPGEAKCTYGTGAFYLLHTGDVAVVSRSKLLTTVAAMTDSRPKYALEGAVFIAGAAVQWLRDGLRLFASAADVERLAHASNPSEPVSFVPGFVGLGAPHWVPEARGVIFGLTRATTAADLGRAALEGVAFQVADLIEAAEQDARGDRSFPGGERAGTGPLRVDGGMANNDWFLQFQADALGRPVARASQSESTALGAGFLAAVGAGLADQPALGKLVSGATHFEPKLPAAARAAKLAVWRKAVRAVVAFYAGGA